MRDRQQRYRFVPTPRKAIRLTGEGHDQGSKWPIHPPPEVRDDAAAVNAAREIATGKPSQHRGKPQIPIAIAANTAHHLPRFRALALLRRRQASRIITTTGQASEKPAHKEKWAFAQHLHHGCQMDISRLNLSFTRINECFELLDKIVRCVNHRKMTAIRNDGSCAIGNIDFTGLVKRHRGGIIFPRANPGRRTDFV